MTCTGYCLPFSICCLKPQRKRRSDTKMKIGIIGAGVSGLVSAKYSIENGYDVLVFEQTDNFGGTWRYTDATGVDDYGIPIHSAMYKDLTTNLPKEIMSFSDLEYKPTNKSYVSQEFFLNYIETYVKKFNLLPHIRFRNYVEDVRRTQDGKWSVTVLKVKSQKRTSYIFDTIIVCNGHYFAQNWPNIPGMNDFKGKQMHSHDYRSTKPFRNKVVGIVGVGPSGVDISKHISSVAKKVVISSRKENFPIPEANNIIAKPGMVKLTDYGCYFADNTFERLDEIIYCTGYRYKYPFFKNYSGIRVKNNWVQFLYRHMINVEHPSMAIILVPSNVSIVPLVEFSVKYYMAYLSKKFELPSKEDMIRGLLEEHDRRISLGLSDHFHKSTDHAESMVKDMAKEAGIRPIPNVIFKIHNSLNYRNTDNVYKIVDDDTFIKL